MQARALMLAAPASGQGKTTLSAGIARALVRAGKRVRLFKMGPDYLDPQILEQAAGCPVEQLDIWMAGDAWCQQQLWLAARDADYLIVEAAMGLYDGDPSSADLAIRYDLPVALLMDVKGMAQTAAALASGLARFSDRLQLFGLIANRCGSARHRELIEDALPEDLPLLASLPVDDAISLPQRHLGLVQSAEQPALIEARINAAADWVEAAGLDWLHRLPRQSFSPAPLPTGSPWLDGSCIGVARDAAFSFIYSANLRLLREMGARVEFFSPLEDDRLPEVDALWLPGGYPELHAAQLAANRPMLAALKAFHQADKPILAECGGMMLCLEALIDLDGNRHVMAGLLAGEAAMRGKRGCQGMQWAPLPQGELRGHAHHRSRSSGTPTPIAMGRRPKHPASGEAIYASRGLIASYLHLYFASNPEAIAKLFNPRGLRAPIAAGDAA